MANPMIKAFVKISQNINKQNEVYQAIQALNNMQVLVGIPQEKSSRKGDITNPELAYIHTHGIRRKQMIEEMEREMDKGTPYSKAYQMYLQANGSPLWRSPPRPIIEPAIEEKETKEAIADQFRKAAKKALDGDKSGAEKDLEKAGMIGQNAARKWFVNPNNNWPPNSDSTIEGKGSDKPLIDTGELRKSITYVVRKK
jgi:hypothetical protein